MIGRLGTFVSAHRATLGVTGAVLLLVGGSWYQALVTPPYRFIDEQAHAGYVLEVQGGHLPTIDTPIDGAAGGSALRTRLLSEPQRRHDVWVANNPPLTYVLAAGPSALTRALGISGGPLMGLRLVNVLATGVAIGLIFLLGRDLADGDATIGLVAAGLVAASPHLGFVAALGFNDGVSFLASVAVLLALARVLGAGPPVDARRSVILLGLACAFAGGTRPMTLMFAMTAGALGFAWVWWRRQAPVLWSLAWVALPTLITSGWFYVLNVHRYGDPTGSDALFDKFGREPSGSLLSALTRISTWESSFRTIVTRRFEAPTSTDPYRWYQIALVIAIVGVIAAVVLVALSAVRNRGTGGGLPVPAWIGTGIVSSMPVVLTAQHRAGGGAPHPRYLLPVLPFVAIAVALPLVRLGTRWAGLALVVVMAGVTLRQTRVAADWLAHNPKGPPGSELVTAHGNSLIRGAGLGAAAVGLVLLCAAIAWSGRRPARAR